MSDATKESSDEAISDVVDLSAPPASEHGSLAELLGDVASAPSTEPPFELAAGAELEGVYRIERRIGAGGMGVVYLARDLELQRDVAVKVHRSTIGIERLEREAVAMAQLAHPNVVTIHGVGEVNDRLYIAMEYVLGDNLSDWLTSQPRSWREILDVMLAAGEGLVAAHRAGFVHRDIKPHNILVGADGRPRVGDFGLVRVAGEASREDAPSAPAAATTADGATPASEPPTPSRRPSTSPLSSDLTQLGTTLGTPSYMAPEQLAGRTVDARADQFAFCVVLYEALYGQRPWPSGTVAELRAQVSKLPPREPPRTRTPAWIWAVLRRGLARDPEARYRDMRSLLAALRTPPRRVLIAVVGTAVVAIGVVGAVMLARSQGGDGPVTCDAAGTPVVAVWGPSARSRIAAHYVRVDPRTGPELANQLAAAIDAWSLRWQRAAVIACEAKDYSWSPAVAAASEDCLHSALDALRGLVARAGERPLVTTDVTALPDVDACADPHQLVGVTPAPAGGIEGYWTGNFGHLIMRRVGDEIWGVYGHDEGAVRGRIINDRFVGWWCEVPSRQAPGDAGDVEMQVIVDRDGVRAIAGRWRYGAEGDWDDRWDLKWNPGQPSPALLARFDDKADFCIRPAR